MREVLPESPMALATGRSLPSAGLPVGDVVERQLALLRPGGGIRLDDTTAGLLDVRFEIGGDDDGLELRAERDVAEGGRRLLG
jgi:hypothetical protein